MIFSVAHDLLDGDLPFNAYLGSLSTQRVIHNPPSFSFLKLEINFKQFNKKK